MKSKFESDIRKAEERFDREKESMRDSHIRVCRDSEQEQAEQIRQLREALEIQQKRNKFGMFPVSSISFLRNKEKYTPL